MNRIRSPWSRHVLLAALILLQACGGGGSNGNPNGVPPNGVPPPPVLTGPEFLYVGAGNSSPATGPTELLMFPIDLNTGALGSPTTIPATGSIVGTVGDPFGRVLYTTEDGVGIHEYSINGSSGALTEFSGSPFATAVNSSVFTDTQNKFVYDGGCVYSRSSTGTLTASPTACPPSGVGTKAAVDPGDKFVFFNCDNRGEAVCVTTLDPNTGALTKIFETNDGFPNFFMPDDEAVHPSGNFVYASGLFVAFAPPPLPSPDAHEEIAVFSLDRTAGQLSAPSRLGVQPLGDHLVMALDPAGKFLYAADTTKIFAFTINGADGSLTPIPGSPFAGQHTYSLGANVFHVDPAGKFLYLTALASNAIFGYKIDPATGALAPLPGSPFPVGAIPLTLSVVRTP